MEYLINKLKKKKKKSLRGQLVRERDNELFQTNICDFLYHISDLTSYYGTYTVSVNIKREVVLSPNDKEVASSKKNISNSRLGYTNHTPF